MTGRGREPEARRAGEKRRVQLVRGEGTRRVQLVREGGGGGGGGGGGEAGQRLGAPSSWFVNTIGGQASTAACASRHASPNLNGGKHEGPVFPECSIPTAVSFHGPIKDPTASRRARLALRLCCPPQHRPDPRRSPSARSPACAIVGAAPACTPPCAPSSAMFGTPPRSSGPAPPHAGRDQCGRVRPRRAPHVGAGQRAHLSTLTQAKTLLHAAHGTCTDAARCSPRARRVSPRRLARRDC